MLVASPWETVQPRLSCPRAGIMDKHRALSSLAVGSTPVPDAQAASGYVF
jgi:hypothetical protein